MFNYNEELSPYLDAPESPGNGTTEVRLSRAPLATEGEATPGPDDWNPYEELEERERLDAIRREREARRREPVIDPFDNPPKFPDCDLSVPDIF